MGVGGGGDGAWAIKHIYARVVRINSAKATTNLPEVFYDRACFGPHLII